LLCWGGESFIVPFVSHYCSTISAEPPRSEQVELTPALLDRQVAAHMDERLSMKLSCAVTVGGMRCTRSICGGGSTVLSSLCKLAFGLVALRGVAPADRPKVICGAVMLGDRGSAYAPGWRFQPSLRRWASVEVTKHVFCHADRPFAPVGLEGEESFHLAAARDSLD
jgi:hypothetical protein